MSVSSTIHLPYIPAFGLETCGQHAIETRKNLWTIRIERMQTLINNVLFNPSGNQSRVIDIDEKTIKPLILLYSALGTVYFAISKIGGYIPIYSINVGISRILELVTWVAMDAIGSCAKDGKTTLENKKWHLLRAIVELTGCGFVLLPVDIVITCLRGQWTSQDDVQTHTWLVL